MRVALIKRRTKSGHSYYADYYLGHKRVRKSLGANKFLAQVKVEAIERELLLGLNFSNPEKRNITVKELAAEYLAATACRRRPRTEYEERNRFEKSIIPALGHLRLRDISQRHIEKWISDKCSKGLKPGSVNRHITSVKAMFKKAAEWDYVPRSPAERIKKLKDPQRSTRFLSTEEAEHLLNECHNGPPHLYPLVLLALHTGMRWSELRHLRWQDMDFKREEVRVENMEEHLTKSGKVRAIPMTRTVKEYFSEKRGIGFLFGNPNGKPLKQLHKSFHSACRRAGIENFRFHDSRHTFASHMTMKGVPSRSVQELLGHGSGRMTERYSHLSPQHMHEAVKGFSLGIADRVNESGHVLDTFAK
jgi:integrase